MMRKELSHGPLTGGSKTQAERLLQITETKRNWLGKDRDNEKSKRWMDFFNNILRSRSNWHNEWKRKEGIKNNSQVAGLGNGFDSDAMY